MQARVYNRTSARLTDPNNHKVVISLPSTDEWDFLSLFLSPEGDRFSVIVDRNRVTESETAKFNITYGDEVKPAAVILQMQVDARYSKWTPPPVI